MLGPSVTLQGVCRLGFSRRDRRKWRFGVRRLNAAFQGVGLPVPLEQPIGSGSLFTSFELPHCKLEGKSLRQATLLTDKEDKE